jgi:hypothetical protein
MQGLVLTRELVELLLLLLLSPVMQLSLYLAVTHA